MTAIATPEQGDGPGHLRCPECESYTVQRLYLATIHCDSCSCEACGAHWDEDRVSGSIRPSGRRSSALVPKA